MANAMVMYESIFESPVPVLSDCKVEKAQFSKIFNVC